MNRQGELAIALIQLDRTPDEVARIVSHPRVVVALEDEKVNLRALAAELHAKPPIQSETAIYDDIRARARSKKAAASASERLGMTPR